MLPLHRRLLACFRALVWALCIAVPLQAAAVAIRGSQLPAEAQQTASARPVAEPRAPHAMPDMTHLLAASDSQHPCHTDMATAGTDQPAQQHHQQHKCSSSCAACCIATALPSCATTLPQGSGGNVLASAPSWATLSCSSPRLERPPRA